MAKSTALHDKADHRQLQQLVAALDDGVILVEPDQTIAWANAAALRMHGIGSVEELGGTVSEYRRRFELRYRIREPGGNARGHMVAGGHARVRRPALGDELAVALDRVVEPEASAAHLAAAGLDREPVVEASRGDVPRMGLEGQRVDSLPPQPEINGSETAQILDYRRLEPDEVGGVVGDALRVRLREADGHVVRELEVRQSPRSIAAGGGPGGLGDGAAQKSLVDDPPAGRAVLALDLVRDTGALPEHVRRHGLVTV